MKILHFSDTHLWIWIENTSRDDDFYNNFEIVIDDIITKNIDLVIHSWDLFHTPKPSNKAISIVVKNFLKLEKKWVKVIIIAWNHDTPRVSNTTHPFEIFKSMKGFYTFYEPKISKINIDNINFVCLPHIHDENIFKDEFKKIDKIIDKNTKNIFISHFWITAKEYENYTDEISWINITKQNLESLKNFSYVALWHYHNNFSIKNIHYSGSIEHTSFNRKNHKIWYNIFDTNDFKVYNTILKSRPIIDFWSINCENFCQTNEIIKILKEKITNKNINWNIIKITFDNISKKLLFNFEDKEIKNFFKDAFYFEYKKNMKIENNKQSEINFIQDENFIKSNFSSFFKKIDLKDKNIDKSLLEKEILELIKNIW